MFYLSRYQTSNVGFDARNDRYGLFVTFHTEVEETILMMMMMIMMMMILIQVEETRAHLSIGKLTLLTRVGGIIGVGKEFLWIMITLLSFILTFKSKIFQLSKIR